MTDFLFGIIADPWPLLAAIVAGIQGLIAWLLKKKKDGKKSETDFEESTEYAPPDNLEETVQTAKEKVQIAKEAVQQVEKLEQKAAPRPKKRAQPTKPPEKRQTEPKPAAEMQHPPLTAQNIRQAIIVSEILGKPKSLRRD